MQPKTMSKVLVAIDFSAQSIRLLECVYDLCQNDVKTIILTHVFEDAKDAKSSGAEWQEVIHQLTSFKKKLVEKGFEVKIVTPAGEAAIEITNLAIQEQVDLIIMASSGKGYIQSALMGSTSFDVVRLAKCPVFVERGKIALKTTNQAKPARLAKVLLPTDFSLASLEALSIVRSLHDKIGEVVFANVIEKSRSIDDLNAKVKQAERNLIELVEEMNARRQILALVAALVEDSAPRYDMRADFAGIGPSLRIEAQADKIGDQDPVGALRVVQPSRLFPILHDVPPSPLLVS